MFGEDGAYTVRFASKRSDVKAMLKLWPTGVQSGELILYRCLQSILKCSSPVTAVYVVPLHTHQICTSHQRFMPIVSTG